MAEKKKAVQKRVEERKKFVAGKKEQGLDAKEARKRFYVQTRVKELEAKGITVDAAKRKELREKFNSGKVSREGFAAPKKTGGSTGLSAAQQDVVNYYVRNGGNLNEYKAYVSKLSPKQVADLQKKIGP
jgi:hypothetical protein